MKSAFVSRELLSSISPQESVFPAKVYAETRDFTKDIYIVLFLYKLLEEMHKATCHTELSGI